MQGKENDLDVSRQLRKHGAADMGESRKENRSGNFPLAGATSIKVEMAVMPLQVFNLACALKAHHGITPLHYACFSAPGCLLFLLIARQRNSTWTYKSHTDAGNYAEPYSDTPVWVPSLRCRQLGSIEPH